MNNKPMGKITDLHVTYISLVKKPATGKQVILRSEQGKPTVFEIRKMDSKLQRVYGIVYAPGQVDSQGDYADADVIRRAATNFLRDYNQHNVDTEHSWSTEMACVAESWLLRSADPLFPEEPEGAWAVGIQIYDPDLWKRLESGELTGLSLAGMAQYEQPPIAAKSEDEPPGWFKQLLTKAGFVPEQKEEPVEVNKEELQKMIAEEVAKGIASGLAEIQKSLKPTEKADGCNGKCLDASGQCPHGLAKSADPQPNAEIAELKKGLGDLTELVKGLAQKGGSESGGGGVVKKSFLD